jgi:uncharacterized protein YceK
MAKKARPSFDAPKRSGTKSAGWVYKSDETAVASHPSPAANHQSPVTSPEPSVAVREQRATSCEQRLDSVLMPLTLLMMTALAPVSWLRGKR